jgi:hypothetical protein
MARLAEYMAELAALLGSQKSVHFVRLDPGSVQLVHSIDFEDQPKVSARLDALRQDDAPADVLKAYRRLDTLLAEDNAVGRLTEEKHRGAVAELLIFPGRDRPKPQIYGPFTQEGNLDGVLISVGGKDDTISLRLQDGDMIYSNCETNRAIARELGRYLFEPIRVYGNGRWVREADGTWCLVKFKVHRFEALDPTGLRDSVTALRAVRGSGWKDIANPLEELGDLRHDKDELN